VMPEGDSTVVEAAGLRLGDVVEKRSQPHMQISRRLTHHDDRVIQHVFVAMNRVLLHLQVAELRHEFVHEPRVDSSPEGTNDVLGHEDLGKPVGSAGSRRGGVHGWSSLRSAAETRTEDTTMTNPMFRLDGKVAVITGASRGIGAACAEMLSAAGADVVIGARSADQLDEVAARVAELGQRAVIVAGDLSTRKGLSALADAAVSELGGIDIVVNNVGGSMPRAFLDTSERAFSRALEFNVTTAFNLSQLTVPSMIERGGGSIINIASTAGQFASRGFAAYGTAKAALIHLTKEMAQDLAPRIRVNAVCPGAITTSALDIVLQDEDLERAMIAGTPLGRLGRPEEIAAAVLYFASPAGAYTTGQALAVSGGIQGSNLELGIADL